MRVVTLLAAVAAFWAVPASAVTQFVTLTGTLTEQTSSGDPVPFGVGSTITLTASFDSDNLRYWGDTGYQVIGFRKYAPLSEFKITMGDNYLWNSSAEYLDGLPIYEYHNSVTGQDIYMGYPMLFFKDGKIAGVGGKLVSGGPMLFLGSGVGGLFYETCNASGCTSRFGPLNLTDTFTFENQHWYGNSYSGPTFTGKWNFDGISAPVPEPASWALMIVGIGIAGGAMRRRRQVVRYSFA